MNLDVVNDLKFIFPVINGKVSMAINRMMYRNFKKNGLDITPEQWAVLACLFQEDGVSQQNLCEATFKDKPSMTRLIDNLVKQNLVYRQSSDFDRRANLIFLTDDGRRVYPEAIKVVKETVDSALKGIDEKGIDQVRTVLSIIFANVNEALNES